MLALDLDDNHQYWHPEHRWDGADGFHCTALPKIACSFSQRCSCGIIGHPRNHVTPTSHPKFALQLLTPIGAGSALKNPKACKVHTKNIQRHLLTTRLLINVEDNMAATMNMISTSALTSVPTLRTRASVHARLYSSTLPSVCRMNRMVVRAEVILKHCSRRKFSWPAWSCVRYLRCCACCTSVAFE